MEIAKQMEEVRQMGIVKTDNIENIIFVLKIFVTNDEEINILRESLTGLKDFTCFISRAGGRFGYTNVRINVSTPLMEISKVYWGRVEVTGKGLRVYGAERIPWMVKLISEAQKRSIEDLSCLQKKRHWFKTKTIEELLNYVTLKGIRK